MTFRSHLGASRRPKRAGPALGGFPAAALPVSVGLALCCTAQALSRATLDPSPWIYWVGVAAIVAPIAYRLTAVDASTAERLSLVVLLGLALYAVKLMRDPFGFTLPDEFPHAFNAEQILVHHRLFSPNPLLPVTPDFPGLEGATSALATLTGMSSFGAGILLIGAARVTLMIALFVLYASISRSSRIAGLGVAIYAGNSNFLLWGAQYAYESLSLPLLVVVLACIAERHAGRSAHARRWSAAIILAILAIIPTHHLTSYLLVVVLVLLSLTRLPRPLPRLRFLPTPSVRPFAVLAAIATVLWLVVVASATVGYISPVVAQAFKSTIQTLSGESPPHALFSSSGVAAGQSNQLGEQVIGLVEVALVLLALPFGLRSSWRAPRPEVIAAMLALAAIGFFGVTALRLVPSAWEISNRSAEFLFIGLAFVAASAPLRRIKVGGRAWVGRALVAAALALVVVGGAITGWPANSRLARPTRVSALGHTIESQTIALGRWAAALPRSRVVAPDADAFTVALYGRHDVLTGSNADADTILTATTLQDWQLALWRRDHVRYVIIDLRQRATDYVTGFYFNVRPPAGPADRYLPGRVATRFDALGAARIFDSGDIVVYDLGATG